MSDHNSNHFLLFNCGTRWLSFWLDFLSATVALTVALFAVLTPNDVINPSLKGLALSYTIQVTHTHTQLSPKTCKIRLIGVPKLLMVCDGVGLSVSALWWTSLYRIRRVVRPRVAYCVLVPCS